MGTNSNYHDVTLLVCVQMVHISFRIAAKYNPTQKHPTILPEYTEKIYSHKNLSCRMQFHELILTASQVLLLLAISQSRREIVLRSEEPSFAVFPNG